MSFRGGELLLGYLALRITDNSSDVAHIRKANAGPKIIIIAIHHFGRRLEPFCSFTAASPSK